MFTQQDLDELSVAASHHLRNAVSKVQKLEAENERLRTGLQMIVTQEYDAGYTAESFADAVLSGHEPLKS
jgi:uncharacterized protein (UPF0335 family)